MRKRLFEFLTKKHGAGTGGTKRRPPWAFLSRLPFHRTERKALALEDREWWLKQFIGSAGLSESNTIMGTVINNNNKNDNSYKEATCLF